MAELEVTHNDGSGQLLFRIPKTSVFVYDDDLHWSLEKEEAKKFIESLLENYEIEFNEKP